MTCRGVPKQPQPHKPLTAPKRCSAAGDADKSEYTLAEGLGARRLKQVAVRANVQSLLVQSCVSIYDHQHASMPAAAVKLIVEATRHICHHARLVRICSHLLPALRWAFFQVPPSRPRPDAVIGPRASSEAHLVMIVCDPNGYASIQKTGDCISFRGCFCQVVMLMQPRQIQLRTALARAANQRESLRGSM